MLSHPRGTISESSIIVKIYSSIESLSESLIVFLNKFGKECFFYDVSWLNVILRTTGHAGDDPRIYVAQIWGQPVAALIARKRQTTGWLRPQMLLSASQPLYTPVYGPILGDEFGIDGLREIMKTIARSSPRFDVLRFDSIDRHSAAFEALRMALRDIGMLTQSFFNFYNYYEDVQNLTIDQYLSARPPRVQHFVARHWRRLQKSGRGRFELVREGEALKSALVHYQLVDLQSWMEPEPFPKFVPDILMVAARAGVLRLGLFYIDDEPVAAQIWIVRGGQATILRSRHARKYAKLAVGTVLTVEMIRHGLQADSLREIDFGCGDVNNKWLSQRRERAGIIAFNPRTLRGLVYAIRHIGGHESLALVRSVRRDLRSVGARFTGTSRIDAKSSRRKK